MQSEMQPSDSRQVLDAEQVAHLRRFLDFRGETASLGQRIARLEYEQMGLTSEVATERLQRIGIDPELLQGAIIVKNLAAQVDVVVHAVGILTALPHVMSPNEEIVRLSLGAGSSSDFDLVTSHQVAEFKFIGWKGGAEAVRHDTLLIDVFNLASADTDKRRVLYLTGITHPLRWLSTSRGSTRRALARKPGLVDKFDNHYGKERLERVAEFWAAVRDTVEIVDLAEKLPYPYGGLVNVDIGLAE
jgi:hypothetical protein